VERSLTSFFSLNAVLAHCVNLPASSFSVASAPFALELDTSSVSLRSPLFEHHAMSIKLVTCPAPESQQGNTKTRSSYGYYNMLSAGPPRTIQ
jgi:hypothetical protein